MAHRHVSIALILALAELTGGTAPASAGSAPVVVVYPLTATGEMGEPDPGGRFATAIANRMAAGGDIIVKPFVPGTDRAHFLTSARDQGADYYVTGFLTAIGDEVTVVEQVVSVSSGTITWSQSAFVKTFADAAAQAAAIKAAILEREGSYAASIDAPTAAPNETPRPTKGANETTGLSFLGNHRHRAPATPSPAPSAALALVAQASAPAAATSSPTPPPSAAPHFTAPRSTAPRPSAAGATPRPTVQPTVRPTSTPAPRPSAQSVAIAGRSLPPTPPPAFGRGSGFANLRSSVNRSAVVGAFAARFAPTGAYLASIEGDTDPDHRASAIDALVDQLRAHPVSPQQWPVGNWSQLQVRSRAETFCNQHSGIGRLYVAKLTVEGVPGAVSASIALTASDCRGVMTDQSSGDGSGATSAAAIRKAAAAAVGHLVKAPG